MKKNFKWLKNNLLKSTFIYLGIFIIFGLIINLLNCEYSGNFILLSILLIIIGIISGTIQSIKRDDESKLSKVILIIACVSIEVIFSLVVLFICVSINPIETYVIIDGKLMSESKHSFLLSNWIKYYDFTNPIIHSKYPRIQKIYDDSLNEEQYLYTIYYDKKGKVIKSKNKEKNESQASSIIYKNKFNDVSVRIRVVDYSLGQKQIVVVEKSYDNEKNWKHQTTSQLIINREVECQFIDENTGFVNSKYADQNNKLLVTIDGGVTFTEAKFNFNNEEFLYIDGIPYIKDEKLVIDIIDENNNISYYTSKDKGLTWEKL